MNSWDIFDTLIARRILDPHSIPALAHARGISETSLERELCFPIAENVSQVRLDDILVSDMHLPEGEIAALVLDVTALRNRVIVTPDGKRTGAVWRELKRELVIGLHTGDDPVADGESARREGIATRPYHGARWTGTEQGVWDSSFPRLAMAMREARLRSFHVEYRAIELAQIEINFPLLYLAALALKPYLQGRRVLASARDCWLFQHLLRDVAGADAIYWYSSRLARAFPRASYLNYTAKLMDDNTILFDLCGTGWSLRRLVNELQRPLAGVWMLAHCGAEMNAAYETLRATTGETRWLVPSGSQGLEHNNLAPHPMVLDVTEEGPLYWNPTGFDWAASPEICAQHEAFHLARRALQNYPEDREEPEPSAETLGRLIAQLPELDFFPREDGFVQEKLKRMADAHR